MLRIQLLLSIISLFVRTELLCSSIRRFPPNRANGVAIFEGIVVVVLLFYVHGKHLWSCRDGQLT